MRCLPQPITKEYPCKNKRPTEDKLTAQITRLESELAEARGALRGADEAIVENCRLCLKYGKGQYVVMDKSMCDNCPTMKQLKTARARLGAGKDGG